MQEDKPINQQQLSHPRGQMVSKKTLLIAIVIALALLSGLWIWKAVEIIKIKSGNEIDNKVLLRKVSKQIDSNSKRQLLLLSKPFVWAIRDKLISGNRKEVANYMNQLVRERNFEEISIVDQRNVIVLSTDKKEEGKSYSMFYNGTFLKYDSTKLYAQRGRSIVLTTPLMNLDKRFGTLSIKYTIPKTTFD